MWVVSEIKHHTKLQMRISTIPVSYPKIATDKSRIFKLERKQKSKFSDSQIIKILSEQEKGKTVMEICQEQKLNNYLTIKTIKNISQSATPGFVFPRQSDLPCFLIRFFPASFFCALQRFAHSNTVFQLFHLC